MHWFHHPHIEVIARFPDGLLLQSDETVDETERVHAKVDGVSIDLTLEHVQPLLDEGRYWQEALANLRRRHGLEQRRHLYRARLLKPQKALPYLYELLEPAPDPHGDQRDQPRFNHHLKVRGAQLPGYEATVFDVSLSGLRLDLHGPLSVGARFPLELDLDDASAEPLRLEVEVRWCRPVGRDYEAGLRFIAPAAEATEALGRFLQRLGRLDAHLHFDRS